MLFLDNPSDSPVTYVKGGWVDVKEALESVQKDLYKTYKKAWVVREIATVHWLHGLLLDVGGPVKSRFQLAGVVNEKDTLVQICYVRCKSGHSRYIADRIPRDSLYTKVEPRHLPLISRVCHKTS